MKHAAVAIMLLQHSHCETRSREEEEGGGDQTNNFETNFLDGTKERELIERDILSVDEQNRVDESTLSESLEESMSLTRGEGSRSVRGAISSEESSAQR
jgi:uncharacterized Rmd1/YagE family protein